jgi:hypothetical protein
MTQLWAWKYEGKTRFGYEINRGFEGIRRFMRVDSLASGIMDDERFITNLRKVKVVDEDVYDTTPPITKTTYLTTKQFIKVWKSLDDAKIKQLSEAWSEAWYAARYEARYEARGKAWDDAWYAAWDAAEFEARYKAWYAAWGKAWDEAWYAARDADLAVLAKDKITAEQFEILTGPWTSCGLSLFVEAEGGEG